MKNPTEGKIYCFQDNDDEWIPEKLERQWKVFGNLSSDVVGAIYTDIWKITRGRKSILNILMNKKVLAKYFFW